MKRILSLFIIFALISTLFTACGSQKSNDPSCADILSEITKNTEVNVTVYTAGDDTLENNYDNMYAIKRELVDDCGILFPSDRGVADELSLFHMKDSGDVQLAKDKLQDRLDTRKNQFAGYKPEEVYKLDNAVIMSQGNFVALIISDDPAMMESYLRQAISDNQ